MKTSYLMKLLPFIFLLSLLSALPAHAAQSGDFEYTTTATGAVIAHYLGHGGEVIIPSTIGGLPVESIGIHAFNTGSLELVTSVIIPDSVKSIESYAFYHCLGITNITIGSGVTSIGYGAFNHCTQLSSVKIGDSVTTIGGGAFGVCTSLVSVTIPNSVTSIGEFAFGSCHGLTSMNIPSSVTAIGQYAFSDCSSLTRVRIGSFVTSLGNDLFSSCTGLTHIYFQGDAPNANSSFIGDVYPTIYYYPGTNGWTSSIRGRSTAEALTFISQPTNTSCNQGRSATFSVSASAAGVTYQWEKDGVDIPNATKATLTLSNVQVADHGNYTVVASNLEGSFTSSIAALTVFPDADGDGLTDAEEIANGSNPNLVDTDGDGISDGDEVHLYHSNPILKDSDADGYDDGFEISVGYSPTSAGSTPQAVSVIHPAVEFEFSADNGAIYQIQQSLDLQNWTIIESNIVGQGRVETRFYPTKNQPKRYFRVNRY